MCVCVASHHVQNCRNTLLSVADLYHSCAKQQQYQQRCHQSSYTRKTPRGLKAASWFEDSGFPAHRIRLPFAGVFHSYWCSGHKFHSDSLAPGCQIWHPDFESGPRPSFKEQHKWKQRRAIVQSHGPPACVTRSVEARTIRAHTFKQRLQGSCLKKTQHKNWKQHFAKIAVFLQMEKTNWKR